MLSKYATTSKVCYDEKTRYDPGNVHHNERGSVTHDCLVIMFLFVFFLYSLPCLISGIRPERLQHFQPDCWQLMVESWDGNPTKRPLLGNVEVKLRSIHRRNRDEAGTRSRHRRLSPGPLPCEAVDSSTDLDSI